MCLRNRDLQPRQPILAEDARSVVSISPQTAFHDLVTERDTLGFDRPKTRCHV
jgi:hypothetical protein